MNSYKRSNDIATRDVLIATARPLFASDGFRGTTIRAIAAASQANIGAVTYHFGSKLGLYHAVLDDATSPVRKQIANLEDIPGNALQKIEALVRGLFAYVRQNPDVPRLILQALASKDPLPPPALLTMKTVIGQLTDFVEAGQKDGTVRSGPPQMLALTCGSQPMFFGIYRRALHEAVGFDQSDDDTSQKLTTTVIDFIRAGLTPLRNNHVGLGKRT